MAVRDPNYGLRDWVSGGSDVWDAQYAGPILTRDFFEADSVSTYPVYIKSGTAATPGYQIASTITFGSAVTAGNFLLLIVGTTAATANNVTTVTDTQGNTWVKAHSSRNNGRTVDVWSTFASATGIPVITVNTADYVSRAMVVSEFSGVNTTAPVGNFAVDPVFSSLDPGYSVTTTYPYFVGSIVGDGSATNYYPDTMQTNATANGGDYISTWVGRQPGDGSAGMRDTYVTTDGSAGGSYIRMGLKPGTSGPAPDVETLPYDDYTRVQSVYTGWLNRYMRSDGAIVRPMAEGNGDTVNGYAPAPDVVSEGTAYAQIYAVQLNDKTTFDLVESFNYARMDRRNYVGGAIGSNPPSNGLNLMMYHFNPTNNTAFDWAAAYDADIDRAKALLWAHSRWGSSGTINYLSRALAILGDLVTYGLRQASNNGLWYMVSGSGNMSISEPEMNNSYLDPAAFKLFAQYDTTNKAKWLSAVDSSYDIIQKTANAVLPNPASPGNTQTTTAKLPANWVTMNFTTGVVTPLSASYRDTNYTYDAFRQTNRLLYDWEYYGDSRAKARLQDYKPFFTSYWTANGRIEAEYFHDGSVKSAYEQRMFYYAAWQVLTVDDPTNSIAATIWSTKIAPNFYKYSSYNSYYDNSVDNTNNVSYYGQSWLLFDELDRQNLYRNYGQAPQRQHTTDVFKYRAKQHSTDVYMTIGTTITSTVFTPGASADDAGETGTVVTLTNTQDVFNYQNHVGTRFPSVTIPQGTTITAAYVKYNLQNYTGTGTINGNIYMEASDNSAQYTTAASNVTGRTRSTATIANPVATNGQWETANSGKGYPITSLVQEILNRSGWASGNAMSVLLIGNGNASVANNITPYSWDYFSGNQKARLTIDTTTVAARSMARPHTTDTFKRINVPNFTRTHTTSVNKIAGNYLTYYFDGHSGITDTGNAWANDANAFDSSTATAATTNQVAGTISSNFLYGEGTTAPTSGGTITSVQFRISLITPDGPGVGANAVVYTAGQAQNLGSISNIGNGGQNWSSYTTLSTPTGGWTWAKIRELGIKLWASTANAGGLSIYHSEVLVTYTPSTTYTRTHSTDTLKRKTITGGSSITNYYFDGHGGITDPQSNWTQDANAFDGNFTVGFGSSTAANGTANETPTSTSSGYLQGIGTTAPTSGGAISQVRIRIKSGYDTSGLGVRGTVYTSDLTQTLGTVSTTNGVADSFSSYVTLTAPSGGWTWAALNNLAVKFWYDHVSDNYSNKVSGMQLEVTSTTNFAHTTDVFKRSNKNYTRDTLSSAPTGITDLAVAFDDSAYGNVAADDSTYVNQAGANTNVFLFKYTAPSSTSPITVTWNGKTTIAPSSKAVYLQIWNYNTSAWETLDSNNSAGANTDFTLQATKSTSVANYYSGNTAIARVYQ